MALTDPNAIVAGSEPAPEPEVRVDPLQAAIDRARAGLSEGGKSLSFETDQAATAVEEPPTEPDAATGEDVEKPEGETQPEPEAEAEAPAPELTPDEAKEARTVVLQNGEAERRIIFATPEDAELVRNAIAGALDRDGLNSRIQDLDAREDELAFARDAISVDPVGYILDQLDPSMRRELATALILQEGVLDSELASSIAAWAEDPNAAKLSRLEIAQARAEGRDELKQQFEERRQVRAAVRLTNGVIDQIGQTYIHDPAIRHTFAQDMLSDMSRWATAYRERHGALPPLKADHIVQITQRRLAVYGVTPEDAKRALDPENPTPPRARPKGPAAEAIAKKAQEARETGKRMTAAAAQRRVAGAIPGGGSIAAPTPGPATPPKGQTLKQRSSWVREKWGHLWNRG